MLLSSLLSSNTFNLVLLNQVLFALLCDLTAGSNITPLAGAVRQMQISRRHTLACDPLNSPRTNALNSNVSVMISPLPLNKRRHTLTTAAILNSARKAVDQAHKVAEQHKRRSIAQLEGPKGGDVVMEGPERRTPLKPVNSRANWKENGERAASTPEGNADSFICTFKEKRKVSSEPSLGVTCQFCSSLLALVL